MNVSLEDLFFDKMGVTCSFAIKYWHKQSDDFMQVGESLTKSKENSSLCSGETPSLILVPSPEV